jgi:hypothetical protein
MRNYLLIVAFLSVTALAETIKSNDIADMVDPSMYTPNTKFLDDISNFTQPSFPALIKDKETVLTLFYFFSFGMPKLSWNTFFAQGSLLKESITSYGVLQGINQLAKENLYTDINKTLKNDGVDYRIKVHPMMFSELNITKVPATVLAECKPGRFSYENC